MSTLSLRGVTKTFGETTVLDSIDLDVPSGAFMVLLGPSGCGKSTLLRIVAGLESPSEGTVHIDETDATRLSPRDRNLAMVFQSYALYPHLTVAKNIAFPLKSARTSKTAIALAVQNVAAVLGLTELLSRRPGQLSGGQRQRVALARAMVRDPDAFLMDEPLSNLDAQLRAVTRAELTELHKRVAKTFLYVTHDQVEAMTMADRIALLNKGKVEQVGTPEQLYDAPQSVFVATFLGAPPMNLLESSTINATRRLTIGIRPERLRVTAGDVRSATGIANEVGMTATVSLTENLGGDLLVHCEIDDAKVCARIPRTAQTRQLVVGTMVTLTADTTDLHLFDPESGRRLHCEHPTASTIHPQFSDIGA